MNRKKYSLTVHLAELKKRMYFIVFFFLFIFIIAYIYAYQIFQFVAQPLMVKTLANINDQLPKHFIYTNMMEVFLSYIKQSVYIAITLSVPVISYNTYKFIAPGLYRFERQIVFLLAILAPLLYLTGIMFCYYVIIPKASNFFVNLANPKFINNSNQEYIKLIFEAKISEYLQFIIDLTLAFGLAFQLPVILCLLTAWGLIDSIFLISYRRLAIVIIFIISGIITPPDVLSQFALAIPLVLLYEISIIACKYIVNMRNKHVRS